MEKFLSCTVLARTHSFSKPLFPPEGYCHLKNFPNWKRAGLSSSNLPLLQLKMAQMHQQQQQQNQQMQQNTNMPQQFQQLGLTNHQSQSSNHNVHQQDKMGGVGNMTMDGSMSNPYRGNDQVYPFLGHIENSLYMKGWAIQLLKPNLQCYSCYLFRVT